MLSTGIIVLVVAPNHCWPSGCGITWNPALPMRPLERCWAEARARILDTDVPTLLCCIDLYMVFVFCFFGFFFFSLGLHLSVELGDKVRAKSCNLLSLPILGVDLQGFVLRKFSQVCGTELPQAQDSWLCPSLTGSALSDVMLKSTVLGVLTPWIKARVTHWVSLPPPCTPRASRLILAIHCTVNCKALWERGPKFIAVPGKDPGRGCGRMSD